MLQLSIVPKIHMFNTFGDFAKEFKIDKHDLLFTHEFIYEPYMKSFELECDVMFQEKYGTGEPSDIMVNQILRDKGNKEYKRIIAIGGGSVVDIAKLLAITPPSDIVDVYEGAVAPEKTTELIIVPTTCGTGSEVTNISMLFLTEKQTKQGVANDQLYADHAVLIPELVNSLPYKFFVYSAIDALIHAVESYVSPKANRFTRMFGGKAIEMILGGFLRLGKEGPDARFEMMEDFVIAATYAGIAFGNAGCAAVHAMSYPLGGVYHVPHGEANYQVFTAVFKEYYRLDPTGRIMDLNKLLASILGCGDGAEVYDALEDALSALIKRNPLSSYGATEQQAEEWAKSVIERQQRLLVNNCVPFDEETIFRLYKELL
ncbi:MAG: 4-hydroxybutyrate dehydrogenase [Christensenellales bacterium]|jgi:4-hydroxybutyrate dehydrogenase